MLASPMPETMRSTEIPKKWRDKSGQFKQKEEGEEYRPSGIRSSHARGRGGQSTELRVRLDIIRNARIKIVRKS